jgi:hypothetical protein
MEGWLQAKRPESFQRDDDRGNSIYISFAAM